MNIFLNVFFGGAEGGLAINKNIVTRYEIALYMSAIHFLF